MNNFQKTFLNFRVLDLMQQDKLYKIINIKLNGNFTFLLFQFQNIFPTFAVPNKNNYVAGQS